VGDPQHVEVKAHALDNHHQHDECEENHVPQRPVPQQIKILVDDLYAAGMIHHDLVRRKDKLGVFDKAGEFNERPDDIVLDPYGAVQVIETLEKTDVRDDGRNHQERDDQREARHGNRDDPAGQFQLELPVYQYH